MNIEDERKAFEAWRDKQPTGMHADLASWLAAKAQAAEMANTYTVEGSPSDGYCIWGEDDFGNIYTVGCKHACESDAKQWAIDNGYRVIDE